MKSTQIRISADIILAMDSNSFEYWDYRREVNLEQGEYAVRDGVLYYYTERSPFLPSHVADYLRGIGYKWTSEQRTDDGRLFDSIKRDHDEVIADYERRNG